MDSFLEAVGPSIPVPTQRSQAHFLRATNLGQQADHLHEFPIRDDQGRTFTKSTEATLAAAGYSGRELYTYTLHPTFGADEVIVFDVAGDATTFTIVTRVR